MLGLAPGQWIIDTRHLTQATPWLIRAVSPALFDRLCITAHRQTAASRTENIPEATWQ